MVISSDNLESLTQSEDRRRHKYLKLFTAWLSLNSQKTKSGYTPICENMQLETRSLLCKKREGYAQQMAFSPVEARWQAFIDNGSEEFFMKYYLFRCAWVRQKHMHFWGGQQEVWGSWKKQDQVWIYHFCFPVLLRGRYYCIPCLRPKKKLKIKPLLELTPNIWSECSGANVWFNDKWDNNYIKINELMPIICFHFLLNSFSRCKVCFLTNAKGMLSKRNWIQIRPLLKEV